VDVSSTRLRGGPGKSSKWGNPTSIARCKHVKYAGQELRGASVAARAGRVVRYYTLLHCSLACSLATELVSSSIEVLVYVSRV
jgi:hypothetical protein